MRTFLLSLLLCLLLPLSALGQGADLTLTDDEFVAWQRFQMEQFVGAREVASQIIAANPNSAVGQAVMGMVMRFGEGNLPRSLYHLRRARSLLEVQFGREPALPDAREWHARVLEETAFTCGEMERFEEELDLWDVYDRIYDPDRPGERIWPMLMLRRFDDAREWARRAIASGDRWAYRQAMNGMCAIENEAGNRSESYRWCTLHANEFWEVPGYGGVYFCNAGESSRGMLRLQEAERYYLEATQRDVEWYANPWMDLASLYVRNGRLAMAANAVRSMNEYARQRPPHTQQQDQSERYRTIAALMIIAGRPLDALPLTERAVIYPDRRGGQSRSPEADVATNALLDRRALLDAAEVALERASTGGLWERFTARVEASWLRTNAFRSGRRVVALLGDEALLLGLLEAESHLAMGTPPWLASDLVQVVGPGPVEAALDQLRQDVEVPALNGYLDTYGAVAAAERGDWEAASELARSAVERLPEGEALMRAQARLIQARALEASGELEAAVPIYLEVLQTDATLIRRAGWSLPVRLEATDDELSQRTAELVRRSPRLREVAGSPLTLQVRSDGSETCQLCLVTSGGGDAGCFDERLEPGTEIELAARICAALVSERLLAPRIDLSLLDPTSLDGSSTNSRSIDDIISGMGP